MRAGVVLQAQRPLPRRGMAGESDQIAARNVSVRVRPARRSRRAAEFAIIRARDSLLRPNLDSEGHGQRIAQVGRSQAASLHVFFAL